MFGEVFAFGIIVMMIVATLATAGVVVAISRRISRKRRGKTPTVAPFTTET